VSLRPETQGLLDSDFFASMRDGAIFINTSRAEVVDQQALERETTSGRIRAGLDVFDDEPTVPEGEYTGSLAKNDNVYCTHHIGASTEQAQEAVAEETVRIIEEFAKTGVAPNAVNPQPA
jgi:D-3-phosphoglycerate dehydrogenase